MNPVFVETGSYLGEGIQQALLAGYTRVISVELSPKYAAYCRDRFRSLGTAVEIVEGDSGLCLGEVISKIEGPITFWLDGHHSCGDTALGERWVPLIQELEHVARHPFREHTVMVDDMRCFQSFNPVHGFCKEDIFEALLGINPSYSFSYEDGCVPGDVLIARVNK